jgi:hypothetical protein
MAGKQKRSEARQRRRSEKRAKKAAKKALYEMWKRAGTNTKSKRVKLRAKRIAKTKVRLVRHGGGPCGNVGCRKCNPTSWNVVTPTHGARNRRSR